MSIQSKLLIMLLGVSIAGTLVVGIIGYRSGTHSLRDAALDRLTELRESRSREARRVYAQLINSSILFSRAASTVQAERAFNAGVHDLRDRSLTAVQSAALDRYYADTFVPALEKRSGSQTDPGLLEPRGDAERYLQARYTVPANGDFDKALAVDDAGDGSAWSKAHAKYHDFFREMVSRSGYEDALIINRAGTVVYSAYKGVDLGTNLVSGPFRTSNLATAFDQAVASNTVDSAVVTDFARYQPSLNVPTAWVASPIGSEGHNDGVLALQIPISQVNEVMTGGGHWEADGLGHTGETFIVGPDHTMRSVSRLLLQDPAQFQKDVVKAGTPPATAERERQVKGSVLLQPVEMTAVDRALRGETGTMVGTSYTGAKTLVAYAPLKSDGLNWTILATLDTDEAFGPVNDFERHLALSIVAIIIVVSLLSVVLAQLFTRPLRRLSKAVREVAAGDLGVEVAVGSRDEIGDLAVAFNDMSHSLAVKQELLDRERAENEKLLRSLMPDAVAERYRAGEQTIAEDHLDVAVIYAELLGFDAFASGLDSEEALRLSNELSRAFDEAADRLGIERVRTLRSGYLASCGLIVPRVDPVRRTLDFAQEMERILEHFNAQHGAKVALRAGVATGAVSSGLIGRNAVMYDLWGAAVDLSFRVGTAAGTPGVFVSQRVYDDLRGSRTFVEAGTIAAEGEGAAELVFRLETEVERV